MGRVYRIHRHMFVGRFHAEICPDVARQPLKERQLSGSQASRGCLAQRRTRSRR